MAHKFKPSYTSSIAEDIMAERLIRAKAVEFLTEEPMRLKSGLISPVYVDNRKLFYYPEAWSDVIETMASRVEEFDLSFDIVAGVEAAGSMPRRRRSPTACGCPPSWCAAKPRPTATARVLKAGA